jgi:hypothetical protein
MIYCFVKPHKLTNFDFKKPRRRKFHVNAQTIEDLLKDPMFRAMFELRQRMKRYSQDIENLNNE